MKILSPIDSIKEIRPLIEAGADGFYCSFRFNGSNLGTPRNKNILSYNLSDKNEFRSIVRIAKAEKKEVFFVLNYPLLSLDFISKIDNLIQEIIDIKAAGIIISNLDLLNFLKKYHIHKVASSLLEVKNEAAVNFLVKKFGINGIILDRQIEINDLRTITHKFPNTKFEAFIFAEGCRSLISACNYRLVFKEHLCKFPYTVINNGTADMTDDALKTIAGRLAEPEIVCGACAMFFFKKYGLHYLKIVGRGKPTELKISYVKFIRKAKTILDTSLTKNDFFIEMEKQFVQFFGKKCEKRYCYYPHFFDA